MKQMMTGYMPFGARRTMTQGSDLGEQEEDEELEELEVTESLRLFIREILLETLKF